MLLPMRTYLYWTLFGLVLLGTPSLQAQQVQDSALKKAASLQDSTLNKIHSAQQLPQKYATDIQSKANQIQSSVTSKTTSYLSKMAALEGKLMSKLRKIYPNATLPPGNYNQYITAVQSGSTAGLPLSGPANYNGQIDSLKTSLSFLANNPAYTQGISNASQQFTQSESSVSGLEGSLNASQAAEQYIASRNQQLTQLLSQYPNLPTGVTGVLNQYRETGYYYDAQIQAYKDMLDDPDKMEKEALSLLSKTSAFQSFFGSNSEFPAFSLLHQHPPAEPQLLLWLDCNPGCRSNNCSRHSYRTEGKTACRPCKVR